MRWAGNGCPLLFLHIDRGNDMVSGISSEAGLQELCRVGVALSEEKDINKLLEMIASVARRYTNAEGCTLFFAMRKRAVWSSPWSRTRGLLSIRPGRAVKVTGPVFRFIWLMVLRITEMFRPTAPSPARRSISATCIMKRVMTFAVPASLIKRPATFLAPCFLCPCRISRGM